MLTGGLIYCRVPRYVGLAPTYNLVAVFFFDVLVDDVIDFLHENLGGLFLIDVCWDWFVYFHGEGAEGDRLCLAREDVERTVDGDGNDGQTDFAGKHESTTFELSKMTVEGACAFREDHHRHTALQGFACLFYSVLNGGTGVARKDLA